MENALDPITRLIEENGNWQIVFKYNNYGEHFMFLLPNFGEEDIEVERNLALTEITEGDFNSISIINNFILGHPNTPFIVQGKTIMDCIYVMNDKLEKSKYDCNDSNDGECTFYKEWDEFKLFLEACRIIISSNDDLEDKVCYGINDWRTLVEK